MKLLFVCTANAKRSPTAETLFSSCPEIESKSAGTNADVNGEQINQKLIDWADTIFVMSETEGHAAFIRQNFNVEGKTIHNLGIPDIYHTNDPELKKLLIEKVAPYVDLKPCLNQLLNKMRQEGAV